MKTLASGLMMALGSVMDLLATLVRAVDAVALLSLKKVDNPPQHS